MNKKVCCLCGREFEGLGNNPRPYTDKGECCDECNVDVIDYRIAKISDLEYPPYIEVVTKTGNVLLVYAIGYNIRKIEKSNKVLAWEFTHKFTEQVNSINFINHL